jgi:hypothetical protein
MAKARRGRRRPGSRPDQLNDVPMREHWRADGQPKTRFTSADEANRASLRLRLDEGADLYPYRCDLCGDWHLGNPRR